MGKNRRFRGYHWTTGTHRGRTWRECALCTAACCMCVVCLVFPRQKHTRSADKKEGLLLLLYQVFIYSSTSISTLIVTSWEDVIPNLRFHVGRSEVPMQPRRRVISSRGSLCASRRCRLQAITLKCCSRLFPDGGVCRGRPHHFFRHVQLRPSGQGHSLYAWTIHMIN